MSQQNTPEFDRALGTWRIPKINSSKIPLDIVEWSPGMRAVFQEPYSKLALRLCLDPVPLLDLILLSSQSESHPVGTGVSLLIGAAFTYAAFQYFSPLRVAVNLKGRLISVRCGCYRKRYTLAEINGVQLAVLYGSEVPTKSAVASVELQLDVRLNVMTMRA